MTVGEGGVARQQDLVDLAVVELKLGLGFGVGLARSLFGPIFLIDLADRHSYQFSCGFRVGAKNGVLGQTASKNTAQAPVLVRAAFVLQRTDISQPLQQSWQRPQGAFFEVFGCAAIHVPHPGSRYHNSRNGEPLSEFFRNSGIS